MLKKWQQNVFILPLDNKTLSKEAIDVAYLFLTSRKRLDQVIQWRDNVDLFSSQNYFSCKKIS